MIYLITYKYIFINGSTQYGSRVVKNNREVKADIKRFKNIFKNSKTFKLYFTIKCFRKIRYSKNTVIMHNRIQKIRRDFMSRNMLFLD